MSHMANVRFVADISATMNGNDTNVHLKVSGSMGKERESVGYYLQGRV